MTVSPSRPPLRTKEYGDSVTVLEGGAYVMVRIS